MSDFDMTMSEALFDDIIDTAQDCIFWKDTERRFVGANKAFLDFYGFESVDVLIGKTDEDMGWHRDPEPFRQDELDVLAGKSTYKVPGKCMCRGEEKDIIASKRPIYRGGEIVGLVGSFADVTEVMRRKREKNDAQVMYTIEQLRAYPYFDKILDEIRLDEILDALTGIISRAYIFDFAKSLISSRTPFTFTIIDLDNFKDINDTYGHHVGDIVLMDVAKGLAEFTRDYGIVGRFGGDELLLINFRDITYDDKVKFFKRLYTSHDILRKKLRVEKQEIFITGTSGCSSYPDDASDYDELFTQIDKTLYHGKNRGRNCFTIYTEEEHAHLEVIELARADIYICMTGLAQICDSADSFEDKLSAAMVLLEQELQISGLYYVDSQGTLKNTDDASFKENVEDVENLMSEEIFADNTLDTVKSLSPKLYETMTKLKAQAILIARMGTGEQTHGYLICAESRNQRLWQNSECAIMYFLARELSHSCF